jgi:hypothetical protein
MPTAAAVGRELDDTVISDALEMKDTDAFFEYRSAKGETDEIFREIKEAFLESGYELKCDGFEDPTVEPCFFLKGGVEEFGLLLYSKDEVSDYSLTEPEGPVPANSTLIVFYYFP